MVENVFGALFIATLAAPALAVIAGVILLALPRAGAARRRTTTSRVPAHP